jgi:tripartite-type tricarboxylate transporter receptor subunit TctC
MALAALISAGLLAIASPKPAAAQTSPAAAQSSAETFYKGKAMTMIVPFSPGGYYDLGARLVARHIAGHIPGKPVVNTANQPSAGGIGLANRFAAGDSDGLTIGVLQRGLPQVALTGDPNIRFDPLKINWLGSVSAYATDAYVLAINSTHPVKTAAQLRDPDLKLRIGSNRSGSTNLTVALVVKEVLGLNYEIVRGYPGAADINLAQQRGEVDAQFADVSFFATNMRDWWESHKLNAVVQLGRRTRLPDLPDVPMARELTKDPAQIALLDFAEMPFFMALPVAAPANLPKDRADALKQAFREMMTDQAFLDEARKLNFVVDPIDGDAVLKIIEQAAKTPKDVIERFKKIIEQ